MADVAAARPAPRLWAPRAWVQGRWRESVRLEVAADGTWADVVPDAPRTPDVTALPGPALPGMVNAHSHAFQRAFVGLAERRDGEHDDFWSWRDRMYGVALTITPERLREVAAHLYAELLRGGYTQVCEFHYLHHAPDGSRYADPLAMSRALVEAARDTGIGLTVLPVLYERAGFGAAALRHDQRRFATTPGDVLALRDAVRALAAPRVSAGVAIHSLRAAKASSIIELAQRTAGDAAPIHIHIAEQTGEVDDCVAASGLRPIHWLARHVPLDSRWQLVHATHAEPAEIHAVAAAGAGVVLCPTTEANLGDGLPDLPRWLTAAVPLSVGSDSQMTRDWREEIRLLEYGQRLSLRRRNVAAAPEAGEPSCATRLFERLLAGGAAAAGFGALGLRRGARADLVVVDAADPALLDRGSESLLDTLVFSSPTRAFAGVMAAGEWVAGEFKPLRRSPTA
ncbi:MAG TPA: formimidoylglutamate deiminase [Burkholderiaceae bacterium]|nr:formimidoylglutamate deiminase [Burkholderiaceae bacterium]